MYAGFQARLSRLTAQLRLLSRIIAVLCGCLAATQTVPAFAAEDTGLEYAVFFEGLPDDGGLAGKIEEISGLKSLLEKRPRSVSGLQRRADDDVKQIKSLLRSKGYYAASVSAKLEPDAKPVRVTVKVAADPLYRIGAIEIENAPGTGPAAPIGVSFRSLGIEPESPGEAKSIAGAKPKLVRSLEDKSYAFAKVTKQRVVVNHDKPAVTIYLTIDTGPSVVFGDTVVTGNASVNEGFIRRRIAWTKGEPFSVKKIDATRQKLSEAGLFSGVTITRPERPAPNGAIEMAIAVVERKKQTIGGGINYSTGDGPGGKAFWTNRNIFGTGESVTAALEGSFDRKVGSVDLVKPDILSVRNTGVFTFRVAEESPDGFESTEIELSGRLERDFGANYKGSAGAAVERSVVEDAGREEIFTLLSLPISLHRDTSNDLLNPTRGGRTTLSVTPFLDQFEADSSFTVIRLHDATYIPLDAERRYSVGIWGRITSLLGEETADVPANKRIYGGGPGSVRGFALNRVGPVDAAGDPIGGRSSTEVGVETRIRVFGDFAVVPFVEAGGVYDETVPRWGEEIQWGVGLGLRYHTAIGPIRLDVAFPINRRRDDDSFQLLISLGQAF